WECCGGGGMEQSGGGGMEQSGGGSGVKELAGKKLVVLQYVFKKRGKMATVWILGF
nr:hypothetical protein [Tanacetum cinerariifolium]